MDHGDLPEGAANPLDAAEGDWDGPAAAEERQEALYLEIDGWEGPLDLLLDLARRQKVDLRTISILELVDQYLTYIEEAEALRLELAADYLVMAAWLAYLKSALLLPKDEQEDPSPEELALRLQLRLQRLGAMREAAARLMGRDRLGRDVFLRGAPEGLRVDRKNRWQCEWFDLIRAYGDVKIRNERSTARSSACRRCSAWPSTGWTCATSCRRPMTTGQIRSCAAPRWRPASSRCLSWPGPERPRSRRKRPSDRCA